VVFSLYDDGLDEEQKLKLVKMKIQKRVEKQIRTTARYFMSIFAVLIIFGGTVLAPPPDLFGMVMVLVACFIVVPLFTALFISAGIRYRTNTELKKYLEGEDLE